MEWICITEAFIILLLIEVRKCTEKNIKRGTENGKKEMGDEHLKELRNELSDNR